MSRFLCFSGVTLFPCFLFPEALGVRTVQYLESFLLGEANTRFMYDRYHGHEPTGASMIILERGARRVRTRGARGTPRTWGTVAVECRSGCLCSVGTDFSSSHRAQSRP